jgi:hypothetical protein
MKYPLQKQIKTYDHAFDIIILNISAIRDLTEQKIDQHNIDTIRIALILNSSTPSIVSSFPSL